MGIVKIRLRGTRLQLHELIKDMSEDEDVIMISEFYPDTRKNIKSKYGRVYIEYKVDVDE